MSDKRVRDAMYKYLFDELSSSDVLFALGVSFTPEAVAILERAQKRYDELLYIENPEDIEDQLKDLAIAQEALIEATVSELQSL